MTALAALEGPEGGRRAAELRGESDDEVHNNVEYDPELVALWRKHRHRFPVRNTGRRTRTEMFLEWAQENPWALDQLRAEQDATWGREAARSFLVREEGEQMDGGWPEGTFDGLGTTLWVDKVYQTQWPALQEVVPVDELPQVLSAPERKVLGIHRGFSVEELGCGYFGCVSPTHTPNLVVKLTSDESEAWFAYVAMGLAQEDGWPAGIVRYHRVLKLEGRSRRGRPIYLLWRDEAWDVGYLQQHFTFQAPQSREATLLANLREWDIWATLLRARITKSSDPQGLIIEAQQYDERAWGYVSERFGTHGHAIAMEMDGRPTPRQAAWDVARAIRACYVVSEWMVNTDGSQEIGSALSYYLDKGIVPADLHMGNIGMAQHEDYENLTPAIIDPGVAIPVKIDWYDVTIPAELSVAA